MSWSMWDENCPSDRDYYDSLGMYDLEYDPEEECCPECGKHYEDFSDLGCEACDVRYPAVQSRSTPQESIEGSQGGKF